MELYRVKTGKYKDRIGTIDKNLPGWKLGNIMFYPVEGKNPYQVCLKFENVELVKKEESR